ncbi:hypothetical protein [Geothrix edaphica]|uniref:Uncharacterized protein n=1 Tax=Geothrix edaphica TaxID=2927976 RepID=A0ABQ5PT53_9BACT|nr:hypothetical protein [Geothrix edaphica]GLH65722.1 hypothetical protein GETHED_00860 [Geothrix edaphica]
MNAILRILLADSISTTFRTFGQLSDELAHGVLEGSGVDRHLINLLEDPPKPSSRTRPENSIVLKPLSRLISEVSGDAPGTRVFALSHCKKAPKRKEKEGGESALRSRWDGSMEDLETHLDQVHSFNLAHLMLEEEGRRDEGAEPSLRYFDQKEARKVMSLVGEHQHSAWQSGQERPDKDHLELIIRESTGKKRIPWECTQVHLVITDWKPALPLTRKKKVPEANPVLAEAKSAEKGVSDSRKWASGQAPLLLVNKDKDGRALASKKRFFQFEGNTNPKAQLSQRALRLAMTVLDQPNAEWFLAQSEISKIPRAFIESAKPWALVAVIKEAQRLSSEDPEFSSKPRRKSTDQREVEELAQILINLEPGKSPRELAERLQHLMRNLEKAIQQAEAWERVNERDESGKIRQRWPKNKPRSN